jgi:glycosyltransferase involved in cell wall biosynthesis
MTSFHHTSLLLVGPDPDKSALGGVAKHMKILQSLETLKNAKLFDPGSLQGKPRVAAVDIIFNCLRMKRQIEERSYSQVWINTSIYPFAFIKLLIMMVVLRKTTHSKKRIFFHGGRFEDLRFLKSNLIRMCVKTVLRKAYSFHFLSEDQGKGFASFFPMLTWHPFRNYMPPSGALPTQQETGTLVFLFVGRMVRTKGIFDILSAAKYLERANFRKLQFWFAGDGEDMAAFRTAAASNPSIEIRILGRQTPSALDIIYARAFALLLPSYREALPYVMIEAMRAGLPIVATAKGAIGDFITSGENGYLVRPRDPKGLSAAICHLLENPDHAQRMGERNRQLFQRYFSYSAAEKYYALLLENE